MFNVDIFHPTPVCVLVGQIFHVRFAMWTSCLWAASSLRLRMVVLLTCILKS